MLPPFDYFQHCQARDLKQRQRAQRFASLPAAYHSAFTAFDRSIIDQPIEDLVEGVQKGSISARAVLQTYGKVAVKAQERTNCITELLLPEAEKWADEEVNLKGPLAGIPVSLKDSIHVKGFDTSVGYTKNTGKPLAEDGVLVKLLKDAGAIPYAKTALPITLLSFESSTPLWGACRNPHVPEYSPGGSSGGEGALIAMGGRIGVGSDVAGSVRVPAGWSGVYSLRCSTGRWPKAGVNTSMAGQEGVPSVFSPMARTLNDLVYFTRAVIHMQPWKYDTTVHPISWREDEEKDAKTKKLRIGVMKSDGSFTFLVRCSSSWNKLMKNLTIGVVPPTPAIVRAIDTTKAALAAAGHALVDITFPPTATPLIGLNLASQLLNSDGCQTFNSHFRTGEPSDPGADQLTKYANMWQPFRYLYYLYVRYIKRDKVWAYLLKDFGLKSSTELWKLVAQREAYRATWHNWWNAKEQNYDFILCPVNATPALPHGAMRDGFSSCGYTFLWNLLDYSAGVIPVDHIDRAKDALVTSDGGLAGKNSYKRALRGLGADNAVSRGAWKYYDANAMHGLPTAVQIVGRRWHEERVLGYMDAVEKALEEFKGPGGEGGKYKLLEV
ncbi:amidase [Emydomyces testavorans]|uniref:Amidase n=1 Tax=Emydomyces testavorans TaxID=2070801 RepID=A0AAF0DIU9_9EURO|nr:amidase [Emydomyces testavorans]